MHKKTTIYTQYMHLTWSCLTPFVTYSTATYTLGELTIGLVSGDKSQVLAALKSSHLGIKNVKDENIDGYMEKLKEALANKKVSSFDNLSIYISIYYFRDM